MAAAVAALTLMAQPAHAAGETYTWTDDTNQSITVAGNNGQVSGTLTKTAATATTTFAGDVKYTCNSVAKTTKLSLTVASDQYKKIYPTSVTDLTVPPDATCSSPQDAFDTLNIAVEQSSGATSADVTTPASQCDNGSVSWLMCPFINNATSVVSSIADKALVPLLRIKQINSTTTPDLFHIWERMRDLAEVMFLLVFFTIIFATITQQDFGFFDQYTIKKILPRLVAAAIMVQASFLFVGVMVDIGNVLGAGVETLLRSTTGAHTTPDIANSLQTLIGGGLAGVLAIGGILGVASWIAIAPLLVSLVLSLLVVFLVLGLRFLLIAVLIAVSPLAMVAWVLPNTRHWAKDWMELLFRLILMYPIIVGVISLAGMMSQILPAGDATSSSTIGGLAGGLINIVVVIAAFLVIPATFKMAGKGLNSAHAILNGHANNQKSRLKGSDFWQRGVDERKKRKNQHMENFMNSKSITSLSGGNKAKRALAGAATAGFGSGVLLGGPASKRALDKSNAQLLRTDSKSLDDMTEAQNPGNLHKVLAAYAEPDTAKRKGMIEDLNRTVPNLAQLGSNQTGRRAVLSRLSDKGYLIDDDINNFNKAATLRNRTSVSRDVGSEFPALLGEVGKSRPTNPFSTMRIAQATDSYTPKDASGRPAMITDISGNQVPLVMRRERGDLDWTPIDLQLRKTTANTLGDKFSTDNWNVILKGRAAGATVLEKRVAQESAERVAASLPQRSIQGAFDVTGRNMAPVEHRLKMARAFESQRSAMMATSVGRDKYEALTADFHRDSDLTHELAREAGVPAALLESLNVEAKALVAYDWMKGNKFDLATYGGSKEDLNVAGFSWGKGREAKRLERLGRSGPTTP